MARVEGFEPAKSGQEPVDDDENPVPVGVWGDSSIGVGVFGTNGVLPPDVGNIPTNLAGVEGHSIENPGVFGESIQGTGVIGRSAGGPGMLGVTFTPNSQGVFGVSTAGGNGVVGFVGDATGVIGNSVRGSGVQGLSGSGVGTAGLSETNTGVLGTSTEGAGVIGNSVRGSGVQGQSGSGIGTVGLSDTNSGVFGNSRSGTGMFGFSNSGTGVEGRVNSGIGVRGVSPDVTGVSGFCFSGTGVSGESRGSAAILAPSIGVAGVSTAGFVSMGVSGISFASLGVGVFGRGGENGLAGFFDGNIEVAGSLIQSSGVSKIDHPLEPAHKYLSHAFVESPDMLNVYNGNVTTDARGEASVTLPDYFEALNQDFRYQLTVIGQFAQAIVAKEIRNNQFTIKTDQPQVKVSWQVTGIRQDPWAVANRVVVEEEKADEEKGRYLHPELWGQPDEARVRWSPPREHHLQQVSQLVPEQLNLPEEPPRIKRTRLEEEWRQVQALVHTLHQRIPSKEGEGPTIR